MVILPDKKEISFYTIAPLFDEEIAYSEEFGLVGLLETFDKEGIGQEYGQYRKKVTLDIA